MIPATTTSTVPSTDVADIVPWGLCIIDRNLGVVQWNRTLERWTEILRHEAIGMNLGIRFPQLTSSIIRERLANVFDLGPAAVCSAGLHKQFLSIPDCPTFRSASV